MQAIGWPEPLISINPHFERGASVADLAADGTLHPDTARIFRVDRSSIPRWSANRCGPREGSAFEFPVEQA
jgi:hypothetical protein